MESKLTVRQRLEVEIRLGRLQIGPDKLKVNLILDITQQDER